MMEGTQGTAIATIPTGGPLDLSGLEAQVYSTFPAEAKGRVVALMQEQAKALVDLVGKTITVEHVLAHLVERVDDDGEVTPLWRFVLASPNGEAWQTTSEGIHNSIRLLAKFYGQPPWKGGLTLRVDQIKTRRGFKTFTLSPV